MENYDLTPYFIYKRFVSTIRREPYYRDEICCRKIAEFLIDQDTPDQKTVLSFDTLWKIYCDKVQFTDNPTYTKLLKRKEMQLSTSIYIFLDGTEGVLLDSKMKVDWKINTHRNHFYWFFAYVFGKIHPGENTDFLTHHFYYSFDQDTEQFDDFLSNLDTTLLEGKERNIDNWIKKNRLSGIPNEIRETVDLTEISDMDLFHHLTTDGKKIYNKIIEYGNTFKKKNQFGILMKALDLSEPRLLLKGAINVPSELIRILSSTFPNHDVGSRSGLDKAINGLVDNDFRLEKVKNKLKEFLK